MTPNAPGKADQAIRRSHRQSILSAAILLVAACLTMWWVKQQYPSAAPAVGLGLAIAMMVGAVFISLRHERHLDEVQIAKQGFAMNKGYLYGAMATILLLALRPIADWLVDLVNLQATGSTQTASRAAVHLAFIYGASLVVLIQVLAAGVAAAIWSRRMK